MRLVVLALLSCGAFAADPELGAPVALFDGKSLNGLYTHLQDNSGDPVFQVRDGALYISGEKYGYVGTKREYENYYLDVEFRWGEKTFPPREKNARDSGILFHTTGPDRVWPRSLEFQMIEGGTGDIILVGDTSLTRSGETKGRGRFDRLGKGPWKDEIGYRDPDGEVEKPLGEWNRLELWADGDTVRMLVNGKLVNEGTGASVRKGRIVFQSEGAELWIRKIELRPIVKHQAVRAASAEASRSNSARTAR
jgi:hypothetical protein